MRRYTISINGSEHEVDVEEVTANTFRVQIAGHGVDVRLRDHQDLAQAMITPNVEVGRTNPVDSVDSRDVFPASQATAPAPAPRPVAAPVATPAAAATAAGAASSMTAPMPGVVLSVSAQPGQGVKRGDPLLVLEAMKMKNELKATRDGVIAQVLAEVGAQVKFGDPLVVFE